MKLSLLLEGLSSQLFHVLSINKLFDTLESNELLLKHRNQSALLKQPDGTKKYPYYLSCSRTISNNFTRDSLNYSSALLELDGAKLSSKFKGTPVDWFYDRMGDNGRVNRYPFESEDRLFSKEETIPNIKNYIKAIHMLDSFPEHVGFIEKHKGDIPLYIYRRAKDIKQLNKKKATKY